MEASVSPDRPTIALVTSRVQLDTGMDRDLPELARSLGAAGAEVATVSWDDPRVDWEGFDLVVIRSAWDYSERLAEFVAWAGRVARLTILANPASVVRWNTDKRYLGELAAAGVPVIPTRYLAPGDPVGPAELPDDGEFVVKPAAGAGARLAARYEKGAYDDAVRHIERLHGEGLTAMVQPYMPRIDETGERALVFVGGRFLHAVKKGAVLAPGAAYDDERMPHPDLRPWQPTPAELDVAERALAAVPGSPELLYARVDLVDDAGGFAPCVMELELVEPNLFLGMDAGALSAVTEEILAAAE
ncbi:RimK family alpha-L-glutamate ligase [Streptomyces sp. NPDC048441]|uniref:ATP-grasp domain-containing protein n=1 Tax=Streptomyces sp. NPDC048441 TaxID=3365552 RepID=UPI00370FECE8